MSEAGGSLVSTHLGSQGLHGLSGGFWDSAQRFTSGWGWEDEPSEKTHN